MFGLRHRGLIDNVTAYLFEAEFVSAGLARVGNPFPAAIFIYARARPDVLTSHSGHSLVGRDQGDARKIPVASR